MKIQFWGAAKTVTGSCHLLEIGKHNVLLDCGLYQGKRKDAYNLNKNFEFNPRNISHLILSHAHIDHSGNIPNLVKQGFKGSIHATAATSHLAEIMLRDSAFIQEKDIEYINRKRARLKQNLFEPLYTIDDALRAFELFDIHRYEKNVEILPSALTAKFREAGHLLGSAFVEMNCKEKDSQIRITYSGDLGRHNMPILKNPAVPAPCDYLILESTYGNRVHLDFHEAEEKLEDAVRKVIMRKGKIVIPAFSIGRTQEIVFALNKLWNRGRLPRIPVYVDSPLSANATDIFRAHPECFNDEIIQEMKLDSDPFGFEGLIYTRSVAASKMINQLQEPCIIISASGMAEAGRVLHHLKNTISNPRNAVFIVGFQAENTLGRKLVEKWPEVNILGDAYPVHAEIVKFNSFSAHGDSNDLLSFAKHAAAGGYLKKIFLVHGEIEAAEGLKVQLKTILPQVDVIIPSRGEAFELL